MNYISEFDKDYELYSECAVMYANIADPRGMPCAHYHNDYEFYFLISSSRKYFLSTQIFTIQPNQIMLIKPHVPHQCPYQVTNNLNIPYERYVLYVSPKMISELCKEFSSVSKTADTLFFNLSEKAFKQAIKLLLKIKKETDLKDKYSGDSIKATLAELLLLIHRNNNISTLSVTKSDIRLQNAIDYIIENYAEPLTLEKCADVACMSHSHFSRVFHQTTSLRFKEFINGVRIDKACELLESTNESIAQIALMAGFSSESYFGYIFRKLKKLSPSKYRAEYGKKNSDLSL